MFLGMLGLFAWNRAEARADMRQVDAKLEGFRALIDAIKEEMKDFHGRLERQDAEFKTHMIHEHKNRGT